MNTNENKSVFVPTAGFGPVATSIRWVLTLCSVLLLAGPVGAVERPFKGRIDGQFVTSPTADPTILLSGARAIGIGTHVGAFTKVTSDVIDLVTREVEGAFTMTAANGDQVTGVYSGFFVPGTAPGTFSWVLNATITGGTGRFFNATGEFVFIANVEFFGSGGVYYGKYTETFDGTIDY